MSTPKPPKPGDRFGIWEFVRETTFDRKLGHRALFRCTMCLTIRVWIVAALRYRKPTTHRGCAV